MIQSFDFQPRTRVIFGEGAIERLGALAAELGFKRALVVADAGLVSAGHVGHATGLLRKAGISTVHFCDFGVNPDTAAVERGRAFASGAEVDSIVGLGGGSSLDCAKGINFVLTNGGRLEDYRGYGKAEKPMLPMIGIPTTTGTGSEAQSYAVIADAETKLKMACGDPKAAFQVALLDPALAVSQPRDVLAMAGFDAVAHVVETWVTTKRTPISDTFSREAWRLLEENYEECMQEHPHVAKRIGAMMLGAHLAGAAIETSMLGAAHACANPLTARYNTIHGVALAIVLPPVVQWNAGVAGARYAELVSSADGRAPDMMRGAPLLSAELLSRCLEQWRAVAKLPERLRDVGAKREELPELAELASKQWTGGFNPRPFDAQGALEIYEAAW
jgi:alcohol dehydrogenase